MQAGRLRHQVELQARVAGSPQRTNSGAPDEAWATQATLWAAIEPLRGKEFMESQAVNSAVTVRIRVRYRPNVDATMRILHGSTVYSIEAVINPNTKNEELQLMCSQGANNG
jgi:SPP1 family predicted phage head-tail adaptor